MNITINNPYASFTCTTKGAELISYTDQDGHQYIWQKNDQYWDKVSPILFPYIGSDIDFINYGTESYPMLHLGLIKDMDFQITKKGAHSVTLSTMSNEKTKQYYPYDFEFSVTFRLRETELEISYTVSNLNKSDMPFLIGGHTTFLCPMEADEKLEEYCLSFVDTDKEDIPLTHQMFDSGTNLYDQFTERKVKLHKNFEHGVVFQFPDFPQLGLWSPPKKNAPFICFQPWCAGAVDELSQKDIAKRKYVQILSSHQSKMYRFSFMPLQKEEIEEAMEDKNAYKLLISHQADFVNIKKYIEIAKKKGMSYKMIDSLEYSGDIALVVAAKDAIEHGENDNILVQPKLEVIKQKNLPEIYYKSMEKCICEFHLDIVRKELPNYIKNYKEIGFLDKLFGSKCPICQKLGGKKRG